MFSAFYISASVTPWSQTHRVSHAHISEYSGSSCTKQPIETIDLKNWIGLHITDVKAPPFARIRSTVLYFMGKEINTVTPLTVEVYLLHGKDVSYVENCRYTSDSSLGSSLAGSWTIPAWNKKDERHYGKHRYSSLTGRLQSIVKTSSWKYGDNTVTIVLKPTQVASGAQRVAYSGENSGWTPYLTFTYFTGKRIRS